MSVLYGTLGVMGIAAACVSNRLNRYDEKKRVKSTAVCVCAGVSGVSGCVPRA